MLESVDNGVPGFPFLAELYFIFFFFQAEDGIRDSSVTGVQTCALPIYGLHTAERVCRSYWLERPAQGESSHHQDHPRDRPRFVSHSDDDKPERKRGVHGSSAAHAGQKPPGPYTDFLDAKFIFRLLRRDT